MRSTVLSAASCESGNCSGSNDNNQRDPSKSIQNFRPAAGLGEGIVYRCASTDVLGEKIKELEGQGNDDSTMSIADKTVLQEGGLIFDLRSAVERKEEQARYWMNHPTLTPKAPVFVVDVGMDDNLEKLQQLFLLKPPSTARFVMRIDVLNQPLFVKYCDDTWLSQIDNKKLLWYKLADGNALHEWRMDELNRRGLAGLNEAILETGKGYLLRALQIITLYREAATKDASSLEDDMK
ncbi:MAG: hypothetical protein SGILL_009194, partial [Bacillariaceae sp.]